MLLKKSVWRAVWYKISDCIDILLNELLKKSEKYRFLSSTIDRILLNWLNIVIDRVKQDCPYIRAKPWMFRLSFISYQIVFNKKIIENLYILDNIKV